MQGKYLVINAGSSSLKFSLYEMPEEALIMKGNIEKIGEEISAWTITKEEKIKKQGIVKNHKEAVALMLQELKNYGAISSIDEIKGVGHRILHGGEYYSESVIIDEDVINNIKSLTKFGPLHHPGEIAGIEAMKEALNVPMVAVFDTAFHQTIKEENYRYAVPNSWYDDYGVRKYGFHGTSHKYITQYIQKQRNTENVNIISCHIGNGASICVIKNGKSFDTTMGLTPLDGLIMGTRCGSIDPSIIEYLLKYTNMTIDEINYSLNNKSGMLGLTGKNDLRDIRKLESENDENAKLALEMYVNSIVKYISYYYTLLKCQVDAIVFTAGVGENEYKIREDVIKKLNCFGIYLNEELNKKVAGFKDIQESIISDEISEVQVYVIPTDEESMILKDTYEIIKNKSKTLIKK